MHAYDAFQSFNFISNLSVFFVLLLFFHFHFPRRLAINPRYGTNANCYAPSMVRECVIMGPGSIDQAHHADEWISVPELTKMRQILRDWLCT